MQGLQISIRRVSSGDLGKNSSRIAHMRRLIEQDTELRRIEPPAARKTGVLQNGEIELDLGNRLVLGLRRQRPYRRQFEGGRTKTPTVCVFDPEQRRLPFRREAQLRRPQGPPCPARIECL